MNKFESYKDFLDAVERATGIQVFDERADKESLPYIVCSKDESDDVYADNGAYIDADYVSIVLFSFETNRSKKSNVRRDSEKKIEAFLRESGLPYHRSGSWEDSVSLYVSQYTTTVYYE